MKVSNYRDTKPIPENPGVVIHDVITAEDGAPNFQMRVFEVEPGSATVTHKHWWEHEIFILSGKGAVVGGQDETEISEGTVIFTAPWERHGYVNKGDEKLRFVLINPLSHLKPKE